MKKVLATVFVAVMVVLSAAGVSAMQHGDGTPAMEHGNGTPAMDHGNGEMSMGAFYFTVTNSGGQNDRLVKVESHAAQTVEVHNVEMTDGVMKMVHQPDGVEIPAGGELVLEPGSYHIMLIGLNQSLMEGDVITATIFFEKAGEVDVSIPVYASEPENLTEVTPVGADLEISNLWARQAPKLDGSATPMASPMSGHGHGNMNQATPAMVHGDGQMSMGAFYFTVTNNGDAADRLVEVKSDVATTVEIHDVEMTDGVMKMVHQPDGVEIAAGETLVLEPGSYHIMLIGLNESLLEGDEFTATLVFENAGEVEITVPVHATEPEAFGDPVTVGDTIEVSNVWARQAPKVDGMATPEATPGH